MRRAGRSRYRIIPSIFEFVAVLEDLVFFRIGTAHPYYAVWRWLAFGPSRDLHHVVIKRDPFRERAFVAIGPWVSGEKNQMREPGLLMFNEKHGEISVGVAAKKKRSHRWAKHPAH